MNGNNQPRILALFVASLFFALSLSSATAEDVWTWKDWTEEAPDHTVDDCSQPYTETDSADDPDRTFKVENEYWKIYYNVSTDHGFVINHAFYDSDGYGIGQDWEKVFYRMFTPWVYADRILNSERVALSNTSVESIVVENTPFCGPQSIPNIKITVKYNLVVLGNNVDLDTVYEIIGDSISIKQELRGHELFAIWDVPVLIDFDIGSSESDDVLYFPTYSAPNKKDNEGFGTVTGSGDAGSIKESTIADRRVDIAADLNPTNPPTNPEAYWLKYKSNVNEYADHPSNYEGGESLGNADIIYWYLGYFTGTPFTNNGDNYIDISLINY